MHPDFRHSKPTAVPGNPGLTAEASSIMSDRPLSQIDPNFEGTPLGEEVPAFHPIPSGPMELGGFAWYGSEGAFCRLPRNALERMNEGVRTLAWHTSGGRVRFRTDSPLIALSAELDSAADMSHMPRTGSGGFDLFFGTGADMRFVKGVRHEAGSRIVEGVFVSNLPRRMRDCTIYFPLYRGVTSARLGLTADSEIQAPRPCGTKAPLVFYGSSITQGGCASRPGNAYTALVARRLDADFINLGFSGSARGEPAMAEVIASMTMSAFIMDYDCNAPDPEHLRRTHQPFFQVIRDAQPRLPVVMVSRPDYHHDVHDERHAGDKARLDIIRATCRAAVDAGDRHVRFVDGSRLFGDDNRDACTVDGCHPNDLGFYRMARGIAPAVREALRTP